MYGTFASIANICKSLMANKLSLCTVKTEFMVIGTFRRVGPLELSPETTPYVIFVTRFREQLAQEISEELSTNKNKLDIVFDNGFYFKRKGLRRSEWWH